MIKIKLAESKKEIEGILKLQKINLPSHISSDELKKEGFVTVEHNFELLQKMNDSAPSVIATKNDNVIAYCLSMTQEFANEIPVLIPMFEKMNTLKVEGKPLSNNPYLVCGQVCIDKDYRGQGLFAKMYEFSRQSYAKKYKYILTEIAIRNPRSIRAHKKIGFKTILNYTDPDKENWSIVLWDWNN